ncbi:hypothetical protein, partial [Sphingomonas sp.]|uniref:hypothetical protein n=1 Tax=Sphingomonas sp. TaxID=28214 RepID=UPI003B3AEE76
EADLATTAFAEGTKGEQVADITEAVQAVISAKDGEIWGYTDVYLEGERAQVRSQETNLGNLSADANLHALAQARISEARTWGDNGKQMASRIEAGLSGGRRLSLRMGRRREAGRAKCKHGRRQTCEARHGPDFLDNPSRERRGISRLAGLGPAGCIAFDHGEGPAEEAVLRDKIEVGHVIPCGQRVKAARDGVTFAAMAADVHRHPPADRFHGAWPSAG